MTLLKPIFRTAWQRFNLIASIVGQVQSRIIVTLLYYTLLVPFALIARFAGDPLQKKAHTPAWLARPPVPTDLDSAHEQG
jgi:hypothetical protein